MTKKILNMPIPAPTPTEREGRREIMIPLGQLETHPDNPRGEVTAESVEELAASIKEKGVLEPLLVVPIRTQGQQWKIARYRIAAGHRRFKACEVAGLAAAPCLVSEMTEDEQLDCMLIENIQREDLTPLQEARAYRRLYAAGVNRNDIARRIGVATGRVSDRMGVLKLCDAAQRLFDSFNMPITAIRLLAEIENADRQARLAQMLADHQLTVPKLRQIVEREQAAKAPTTPRAGAKKHPPPIESARLRALESLVSQNGEALLVADARVAMEVACKQCGLGDQPARCAGCPLPNFVSILVERRAYEKEVSATAVVDANAGA